MCLEVVRSAILLYESRRNSLDSTQPMFFVKETWQKSARCFRRKIVVVSGITSDVYKLLFETNHKTIGLEVRMGIPTPIESSGEGGLTAATARYQKCCYLKVHNGSAKTGH